jgi:hypothetical protein
MPSIRQPNLDYLEPLGDTPVIIVDDSNGNIPKNLASHVEVLNYDDRDKLLGDKAWLIPQKSPSCKNLGLYKAYSDGYDCIILLDDDCDCRVSSDFMDKIPIGKPRHFNSYDTHGGWINTMNLLNEPDVWARGFPYEHRTTSELTNPTPELVVSMFNEGLWTGTADINGIDKLAGAVATAERSITESITLKEGQQLPLSIMNVQLHRDLIPAFYQPPDYKLSGNHMIRRHDDVWSMMVLKRIMDLKWHAVTVGEPLVWHRKEGDMHKEILSEHGANLVQPYLTSTLDMVPWGYVDTTNYALAATKVGDFMEYYNQAASSFYNVLDDYAKRIQAWASLFISH